MSELRLEQRLREAFVPEEGEAEVRGWRVVHGAFEARHPVHVRPRLSRLAIALAAGLLIAGVALTPAGAKVADVVHDVVEPGSDNAHPALTSLPASGRLLVNSPQGPWIVDQDGSQRLLGDYQEAAWSPTGSFAAVTRGRQLTAVDPVGNVRWSLAARRPVSNPAWSPSGIRVAYMSGSSLRVVAGDGLGDRPLADRVAPVTPAWRPLSEPLPPGQPAIAIGPKTNLLAYVDRRDRVTLRDLFSAAAGPGRVDAGSVLWHTDRYAAPINELQWSADRKRLLVRTGSFVDFLDARGRTLNRVTWPTLGASMSPDGKRTAFVRRVKKGRSEVVITGRYGEGQPRSVLTRAGRFTDPTWSPDGKWLLVARRDADQWLFIRPSRSVRVDAIANISRQFAPGASGQPPFPGISGWVR
jgi:dipeptidyl aminopeptidase/acylaminoacyl peptidase